MVLFKPGYHVSPSESGNNWYCLSATLAEKFVFHFTVSNRKYKTRFYFSLYFLARRDIGDLAEVGSAECLCWFRSDRLCIIWQEHKHQASAQCPGSPIRPDKITTGSQPGDSFRSPYTLLLPFCTLPLLVHYNNMLTAGSTLSILPPWCLDASYLDENNGCRQGPGNRLGMLELRVRFYTLYVIQFISPHQAPSLTWDQIVVKLTHLMYWSN